MLGGMKLKTIAKEYIDLTEVWDKADKSIVINNIERVFGDSSTLKRNKDGTRINTLSEITNTDKNTVRAWMNQSRSNVKIPLLKLCMIADALHIDIYTLLCDRGSWKDSPLLDERQIKLYDKIRKVQFYTENGWDIPAFVAMLKSLSNSDALTLLKDCKTYFQVIVGVNDEKLYQNIFDEVNKLTEI